MKRSIAIRVTGIVQGVGFRPFIYNLAVRHRIAGLVLNDTEGVFIEAEAEEEALEAFISAISAEAPPLSYIHSVSKVSQEVKGHTSFMIEKSRATGEKDVFYSPDVAVCDRCLKEFSDPRDRRFCYPFITCMHCGPRFSIIRDVPYDRHNTSMDVFPMCPDCVKEYADSSDRRFHTQPTACPVCGPRYRLFGSTGSPVFEGDDIAERIVGEIKSGKIVAIKSVGGYLLALDAANTGALRELRLRKKRPFKPFALMAGSMDAVRRYAVVNPAEERLLLSKERPIVLLKIRPSLNPNSGDTVDYDGKRTEDRGQSPIGKDRGQSPDLKREMPEISPLAAPGLTYLGFMLPYVPLQHRLFAIDPDLVLVMTSGNYSEEPIVYGERDLFRRLGPIADYLAVYDREILGQSDDSVLFVVKERPFFARRARGYVPLPFHSSYTGRSILALGGDLKNCFGIARKDFIILSQHLGDMADPQTFETFRKTVDHFITIFDADPDTLVADLHPGYLTTQYADERAGAAGREAVKVQHHHAHIASVMEDRGLQGRVIGVAFDGTGYGPDGTLWGSEILIAGRDEYERAAHFSYFPLPGGENAIRDVWKIGLSLLMKSGVDADGFWPGRDRGPLEEIIARNIGSPLTCSIGRLFDGVSAILGLSESVSAEAEAAILLEEAAYSGSEPGEHYIIPVKEEGGVDVIDTMELVRYLISLKKRGMPVGDIARAFHYTIVISTIRLLETLREKTGLNRIAASGGVFHNRLILDLFIEKAEDSGFEVYLPQRVPFNDGCISLGQIAVSKAIE